MSSSTDNHPPREQRGQEWDTITWIEAAARHPFICEWIEFGITLAVESPTIGGSAKGRPPGYARAYLDGYLRGYARGLAKGLLRLLTIRCIPVPVETRERILACSDLMTLEVWIGRAITVTAVDELFG